MIVDGYIRVSQVRGREGDRFISPAVQREQIETWARSRGALIGRVFEELDQSGARSDRPLLAQALARVERHESDGVVVAKLDRFGRSLVDGLAAIERIRGAGGTFVSVTDGLDLTTDTGKLVLRMMLSMAEWELDRIRSQWATARQRAVARGVHMGPKPPAGYQHDPARRLMPDPAVAPLITEIFRLRAAGARIVDLCRVLDEAGVQTAYGNLHWTPNTVSRVLQNRVYLGELRHGDFINDSAHPALTDPITWQQAQSPRVLRPRASTGRTALLTGLLRCAGCRMMLSTLFSRRAGIAARVYSCAGHSSAGPCPSRAYISASVIEPYIEEVTFALLAGRRPTPLESVLERLARKLDHAEQALAVYRDDPRVIGALGGERFAAGLARRARRAELLRLEIAAERSRADSRALPTLVEVERRWPEMTTLERKALIAQTIDCAFVARGRGNASERVYVCARGDAPVGLPRPGGKHHELRAFDPAECRRARPPAAIKPRRPAWTEERIAAELASFLEQVGRDRWPDDAAFVAAGRGQLLNQIQRAGGIPRWAARADVHRAPKRRTLARWDETRMRATLDIFLADRATWPSRREFAAAGYDGLHTALRHRPGIRAWAAEYGLPVQQGGSARPRKWTEQRIRDELTRLIDQSKSYPRARDFQAAGRSSLYRTIAAGDGHREWARRMNVVIHP